MKARKSRRCLSCRLDLEVGTIGQVQCGKCKKGRLEEVVERAESVAKPTKSTHLQRKTGGKRETKGNYSVSLPVSRELSRVGTPCHESRGTQVRFQKEAGRLDTFGTEQEAADSKLEMRGCQELEPYICPTPASTTPSEVSSSEPLHFQEVQTLRTQLLHALSYQDSLYQEIHRITLFLEAEKLRWLDQIKRLKDEHMTEVEALKRAYEEKGKLAQSAFLLTEYNQLIATCDREKAELRASLEDQYRTSLALIKEQLKRQYDLERERLRTELVKRTDEEKTFVHEELVQRLARQESRVKEEARLEMEESWSREKRLYEDRIQDRIGTIKGEYERKLRELQQQSGEMKREIATLKEKRPALEEAQVNLRPLQRVLCYRCNALVQISALLDGKLDRYRGLQ